MKVSKIHLLTLRNEEHFQFMTNVKLLVSGAGGGIMLNIDELYTEFTGLLSKEDQALEVIRKSGLTDPITESDAERDAIYFGFVTMVNSYSHSTNALKLKATHNIQIVIDHYGDFRKKPYNEETATIYNFLQEMNDRCAADIAQLNAQHWITDLTLANEIFAGMMMQRSADNAGQETINMRDARRNIDGVYTAMIDRINASILLNGEAAFTDFVKKLNDHISYFKNTVTMRKAHAAARKEASKGDE